MAPEDRPPQPRSVPTLATVAAAAGVSPATVSRVINGSAPVSAEHRAAVEAAVARLGYVPNPAARSLATKRTGAIALLVREPMAFGVSDPYLSTCIITISQQLTGTGRNLVVMVAKDDEAHQTVADYVRAGHVDGAILLSVHAGDPLPGQLHRAGIPLVVGGRPPERLPGVCSVDCDNLWGGRLAAQHLLHSGRRRIAAISGPGDMTAAIDRLKGFRAALREAGRDTGLVEYAAFTRPAGERAMRELLEREPDVDAVFAASDGIAAGALQALRSSGRRVPEDVAIVGFDDVELASYTDPPLTTVRQPAEQQAAQMVESLVAQIRGEPSPGTIVMPVELVVRASA